MIRIVLILSGFFWLQGLQAQQAENIAIGKKISFHSAVLGENRRVWVYEPGTTAQRADSSKRYPVLYLLDGDAHFFSTVGIIQQLSQSNGNGILPEMIVVAVEHVNRLKELTPVSPTSADTTPGSPFVRFLSSELMPYVDKHFSTAPYRLLVGHSLGGLMAIHIMANHPGLFNAYIAIDPSMWFGNEMYLKQIFSRLTRQRMDGIRLFMGTANTMPPGMQLAQVGGSTLFETQHIRSMLKLNEFLKNNGNGLKYEQVFYEKERHNSVPLICEYDGLKFIFNYYALDLTEKGFIDGTPRIAQLLKAHYTKITAEMGYPVAAPRTFVTYLGYDALEKNQFSKAEALFQLNVGGYPEHADVHEAFADFLAARKDTAAAVASYRKAISIHPDPAIVAKLSSLTGQQRFKMSAEGLKQYQGVYTIENYKVDIVLTVQDGKLIAKIPGQPASELLPMEKDLFTVKEKQGYRIKFQMSDGKPEYFISEQPNGIFKVIFKR